MSSILAVDWGTSSFRLMHVGEGGKVLVQIMSDQGISVIPTDDALDYLLAQVEQLSQSCGDLTEIPIVLCGMIGSSIGIQEVAYANCPMDPDVLSDNLTRIENTSKAAYIVPGLKNHSALGLPDVMRGEETQIVGWLSEADDQNLQESTLCLPGTHSKWVHVKSGKAVEFHSVLTGELFAVLKRHSILVNNLQTEDKAAFIDGVNTSKSPVSLPHLLFSTRSKMLFGDHDSSSTSSYLSGLLIGSEIGSELSLNPGLKEVHIIGGGNLTELYIEALNCYGLTGHVYDGDKMSALGLWKLSTNLR